MFFYIQEPAIKSLIIRIPIVFGLCDSVRDKLPDNTLGHTLNFSF